MAFEEGPGKPTFARIVRETEGRTGEPVDYGQIVMAKLVSVLACQDTSSRRLHELRDLERVLVPHRDAEYTEDMIRILEEREACLEALDDAKRRQKFDADYQGWWLEALMHLMRRNGLLGTGGVRP